MRWRMGNSSRAASGSMGRASRAEARRSERRERARERVVERAIAAGQEPSVGDAPSVKAGQDVRHPKFGEGVVLDVAGAGDNAEVTINFVDVGQKTLLLGWANLEVV